MYDRYCRSAAQMVIFSHFIKQLNRIQKALLSELALPKSQLKRIDGNMTAKRRQVLINQFQSSKNTDPEVFLLSNKAASVGIDLTRACHLILVDDDFNPVHNNQVTA
jgi:SNF2 family DNA or RNA helicase